MSTFVVNFVVKILCVPPRMAAVQATLLWSTQRLHASSELVVILCPGTIGEVL
jgi:hypothetical protein